MENEVSRVKNCLRGIFTSASDIYVDPDIKECEVKVSGDEYQGEIFERLVGDNVYLEMVDFCDTYPYKYVFSYKIG